MNILEKALSTKLITAAIFDPDLRVCCQISIEFYEYEFLAHLQEFWKKNCSLKLILV